MEPEPSPLEGPTVRGNMFRANARGPVILGSQLSTDTEHRAIADTLLLSFIRTFSAESGLPVRRELVNGLEPANRRRCGIGND